MSHPALRYDLLICILIGLGLSFIPVKILEAVLPQAYEKHIEKHTVSEGDIGGVAPKDTFKAQNINDLLSHDTFTVVSPGMEYRNIGMGYYGDYCMYMLTLPSKETIAAIINESSVQRTDDDIFMGDSILPVGKIIYEDLSAHPTFLGQIEAVQKLSRTDFYVDMLGTGGYYDQEDFFELPILVARFLTIVISFPILHTIGSKIGIFPYFFEPKNK